MNDQTRSSQLASLKIVRPVEETADPGLTASRWPMIVGAAVAGGAAMMLLGWWLWGRHGSDRPPPAAGAEAVAAAAATVAARAADPGALVASGYVVARRRATVAAEITGRVAEVLIEEGMVVKKGQLLARLDDTLATTDFATATSKINSASAAAAATRAELADAERIQRRTQELARSHLASEADVTRTEAQAVSLKAQLTRTEADLATVRSETKRYQEVLAKHRVVAPFAGVIVDKIAQPGEIISPMSAGGGFTRTGICSLVDMDSLEIEVDVNESYISRVKPEQAVTATLDAYPDWSIPGRVIAIVPTANREKATVRVRISILSKDPRILPDMAVKVSLAAVTG